MKKSFIFALLMMSGVAGYAYEVTADLVCTDADRTSALKNASSTVSVQLGRHADNSSCIAISGTTPGGYQFERTYCTYGESFKAVWSDRTIRAVYGSAGGSSDESWLLDRMAGTLSGTGQFMPGTEASKFKYRDLQCAKVEKPKF